MPRREKGNLCQAVIPYKRSAIRKTASGAERSFEGRPSSETLEEVYIYLIDLYGKY